MSTKILLRVGHVRNVRKDIVPQILHNACHWVQDGLCDEHMTSLTRCRCPAQMREAHCFACGSFLIHDGSARVCLLCEGSECDPKNSGY